jgi:hypothetical protein
LKNYHFTFYETLNLVIPDLKTLIFLNSIFGGAIVFDLETLIFAALCLDPSPWGVRTQGCLMVSFRVSYSFIQGVLGFHLERFGVSKLCASVYIQPL